MNREEQAVGDAEHRDDDAHGQQRVEQVDDLVELGADVVAVLRAGADLGRWEVGERGLHLTLSRRRVGARHQGHEVGQRVAQRRERPELRDVDHHALHELRVAVLGDGRERGAVARGAGDAEALADRDAVRLGELLLDDGRAADEALQVGVGAVQPAEAVGVAQRERVDPVDLVGHSADLARR